MFSVHPDPLAFSPSIGSSPLSISQGAVCPWRRSQCLGGSGPWPSTVKRGESVWLPGPARLSLPIEGPAPATDHSAATTGPLFPLLHHQTPPIKASLLLRVPASYHDFASTLRRPPLCSLRAESISGQHRERSLRCADELMRRLMSAARVMSVE